MVPGRCKVANTTIELCKLLLFTYVYKLTVHNYHVSCYATFLCLFPNTLMQLFLEINKVCFEHMTAAAAMRCFRRFLIKLCSLLCLLRVI